MTSLGLPSEDAVLDGGPGDVDDEFLHLLFFGVRPAALTPEIAQRFGVRQTEGVLGVEVTLARGGGERTVTVRSASGGARGPRP